MYTQSSYTAALISIKTAESSSESVRLLYKIHLYVSRYVGSYLGCANPRLHLKAGQKSNIILALNIVFNSYRLSIFVCLAVLENLNFDPIRKINLNCMRKTLKFSDKEYVFSLFYNRTRL